MDRFIVVLPKENGGVEVYPMREWLRNNPHEIPAGLSADNSCNSHRLRDGLRRNGWTVQRGDGEVRLLPPGKRDVADKAALVLGADEAASEEIDEAVEMAFQFEAQLRDFIAQNLSAIDIDGAKLSLFVDSTGRNGVEYPTRAGPIDILARDGKGGLYVFELKRARSPDHAIGQIARYMGCLKHELGMRLEVKGVIVAREISENLKYAIAAVPNVSLFEYQVHFTLKRAEQLCA